MSRKDDRRPRWLRRRNLYAGGALMVLAPFAGGCDNGGGGADAVAVAPADIVEQHEVPDGYVPPEVIAIAPPFDPGPLDVQELIDPDAPPELIAIAPPPDPGPEADVLVIAPVDVGEAQDVANPDLPPEVIAIVAPDVGPVDAGPGETQEGDPCFIEGARCSGDLWCTAQAICVVPTDCCGGCRCEPWPCNPDKPSCPDGAVCEEQTDGKGRCVAEETPPVPGKGGFMADCQHDEDCLQEYFCEQTMFCIAPPPGYDGPPPDGACGARNCVPVPCNDGGCPEGSLCVPYPVPLHPGPGVPDEKTCVRHPLEKGEFGQDCEESGTCPSDQYQCVKLDGCPPPLMCIMPVDPQYLCLPIACGDGCPEGTECKDVGIGEVCVKKAAEEP